MDGAETIGVVLTPFLDAPEVRLMVTLGPEKTDRDRLAFISQLGGRPPDPALIEEYGYQQVIGMNAEELGELLPLLLTAYAKLTRGEG